jgi:hypothetical protein
MSILTFFRTSPFRIFLNTHITLFVGHYPCGTNLKQNRAFDKRFRLNLAEKMQGACFDSYPFLYLVIASQKEFIC